MKHVTQYLDMPLIETAIAEMEVKQKQLTRDKAALRVRIWRLNQILAQHRQLVLPLREE